MHSEKQAVKHTYFNSKVKAIKKRKKLQEKRRSIKTWGLWDTISQSHHTSQFRSHY